MQPLLMKFANAVYARTANPVKTYKRLTVDVERWQLVVKAV